MKPIITIDSFEYGIVQDPTIPAKNGFSFNRATDIHTDPGYLQASQSLIQMVSGSEDPVTTKVYRPIYWMTNYTGSTKFTVGYGNGILYGYNLDGYVSGAWSTIHTSGGTGQKGGLKEYDNSLFFANVANLGAYNGTTWNDSYQTFTAQDTAWHPMEVFLGKLMIGDGRYIATKDSTGFNATALTLPAGFKVRCLSVFGDYLMIGTYQGDEGSEVGEATLFSWDGVSELPNQLWKLKEQGIYSILPWKNTLLVFAGLKGNIYQFDGASLTKISKIPGIETGEIAWVNPGAVSEYRGNAIFGVSSAESDYATIFMLGQNKVGDPIALTSPYNLSIDDVSNVNIYAILPQSIDNFYVSYYDGSAYGIDITSNSIKDTGTNVYWESQVYEIPREDQNRILKGIETVMNNTNGTITVKYKLDDAISWSTLGETDYQNQLVKGIDSRAKNIQLRLEFESLTNVSPKIKTIKIF